MDIAGLVERLAESQVLIDASDLPALAELHTLYGQLEQMTKEAGQQRVTEAVVASMALIEKIILNDVPDPNAAMTVLGAAVGCFQEVVRDGRDPEGVNWPVSLTLGGIAAPDK